MARASRETLDTLCLTRAATFQIFKIRVAPHAHAHKMAASLFLHSNEGYMFRLGKFISKTITSSRPRPVLIKLCIAWDWKLVLLHKSSLKDFHIKRLFLREDVPPEHKLRVRKVVSSLHSSDLNQGSSTTAVSHPSHSTAALTLSHSLADNPSSNVGSPPATVCAESSNVVHSHWTVI